MYQDYKGFVHADKNGFGEFGFHSIREYANSKIEGLNYSEFVGLNINFDKPSGMSIFFIVKDEEGKVVKHVLEGVNENIFKELFTNVSIMIYDNGIEPPKNLEETFVLESVPRANTQ